MTCKYSYLMLSYILRTIKLIVLIYWIWYNLLNRPGNQISYTDLVGFTCPRLQEIITESRKLLIMTDRDVCITLLKHEEILTVYPLTYSPPFHLQTALSLTVHPLTYSPTSHLHSTLSLTVNPLTYSLPFHLQFTHLQFTLSLTVHSVLTHFLSTLSHTVHPLTYNPPSQF